MALRPTQYLDSQDFGFEWFRVLAEQTLQEGVIGAGDFKTTAAAGGGMKVDVASGVAFVKGETGTPGSGISQGLYMQVNDATIANAVTLTASHGTLPRIDQIVLTVNDSSDLGSASDSATLSVVTGTATAGVTLDNRTGAVTPALNTIRLADVLVPAASASVTAGNIRDRRKWARGAFYTYADTTNTPSTNSTTYVDVDATHTSPRVELSGKPLIVTLSGDIDTNSIDGFFRVLINGVSQGDTAVQGPFPSGNGRTLRWELVAPAGVSHLVQLQFRTTNVTSGCNVRAPWTFTVEEDLRSSGSNT
jgi:hypothetical protein